jgi:hypothetical protein
MADGLTGQCCQHLPTGLVHDALMAAVRVVDTDLSSVMGSPPPPKLLSILVLLKVSTRVDTGVALFDPMAMTVLAARPHSRPSAATRDLFRTARLLRRA